MGPHHSWVEGLHSSSGDSGGHLHRRHCRAPRAPILPMPQPLGRKKGVYQEDSKEPGCVEKGEPGQEASPSRLGTSGLTAKGSTLTACE